MKRNKQHRPARIDAEIADGLRNDLFRRAGQPKKIFGKHDAGHRQKNTGNQREAAKRRKSTLYLPVLPRPEILRNDDRDTASYTDHEGDNEIVNEKRSRNGCQRLLAQKTPDDHTVGKVINLLNKIADKQRKSKRQDNFPDRSLR